MPQNFLADDRDQPLLLLPTASTYPDGDPGSAARRGSAAHGEQPHENQK
jgi:hypothetical protein